MGKNVNIEFKWAIIGVIIGFLIMVLLKVAGMRTAENFTTSGLIDMVLSTLVYIAVYYFCLKEKRDKALGGQMTWTQGFWTAAILSLLIMPFASLLNWLYAEMIDPGFFEIWTAMEIEGGKLQAGETFGTGDFLALSATMGLVFGLIYSLIMPLFVRTKTIEA